MKGISISKPRIGLRERIAVDSVLRSGKLAQGELVARFEREFSAMISAGHGVAVNSGTSGLHIALLALGVGPGDEILVPAFTFAATANAVALTGAKPVFVDIDATTMTMSPLHAASQVSPRTVGMIPVHLYGLPSNMPDLLALASARGIFVLEDSAQSHLASIDGSMTGSMGKAGVFSFYPTKNMTTGEGGMITTNDDALARRMKLLRNQGMEVRYQNEVVGLNNRMTEIGAAIGLAQLKKLGRWTERRIQNASHLASAVPSHLLQDTPSGYRHVYHQFTVRIPDGQRDAVRSLLRDHGVASDVYYPFPVSSLAPYRDLTFLPETERACSEVISVPVRHNLKRSQLSQVRDSLEASLAKFR